MAMHIKNLLQHFITKEDNWRGYLMANWSTILGTLKDHVSLEKIYDDTIVLGVNNSSWMHELHMLSGMLINKINQHLPEPRIKKIRFKFIEKKEQKKFKRFERRYLPEIKITLNVRQEKALSQLKDEQMSEYLTKYLAKCMQK